jgi:uncharacterized membrane protein
MRMRNEIAIAAPAWRIFERASATARWPEILPHYRYVRVLSAEGARSIVEMAARRPIDALRVGIPVRWRAEQIDDRATPQIYFRHLGGWTNGMEVYWRFTPQSDGTTLVQIDHELRSPLAPFIGAYFVHDIASRTLARMKAICEAP